MYPVRHIAI